VTCALAFAEPHRGPSRLTRQEAELQTPGASKQIKYLKRDSLQHHVQSVQIGKLKSGKIASFQQETFKTLKPLPTEHRT